MLYGLLAGKFEGHNPVGVLVPNIEHLAHASAAQELQHLIAGEDGPRGIVAACLSKQVGSALHGLLRDCDHCLIDDNELSGEALLILVRTQFLSASSAIRQLVEEQLPQQA